MHICTKQGRIPLRKTKGIGHLRLWSKFHLGKLYKFSNILYATTTIQQNHKQWRKITIKLVKTCKAELINLHFSTRCTSIIVAVVFNSFVPVEFNKFSWVIDLIFNYFFFRSMALQEVWPEVWLTVVNKLNKLYFSLKDN